MSLRNHSWRNVLKVLNRYGFVAVRQRGDHIMMSNSKGKTVVVPKKGTIKVGTMKSILHQSGILQDEFIAKV